MAIVSLPILYAPDPTIGKPLGLGNVYIGEVDKDPELFPQVYNLIDETGAVIPIGIGTPITLSAGGTPTYNGSPVQVDTSSPFSMRIRNQAGSQVYYFPSATGNETVITGMQAFATVADMVADTDLSNGDLVVTYAYNAAITSFWKIVPAATGIGDMSDGYLDLANGLQAKIQIEAVMNPKAFGAFGDGTTDDTTPLSNCLNNSKSTVVDVEYAITNITYSSHFTCTDEGSLKYIGAANGRMLTFIGDTCGLLRLDADNNDVNLFYSPDTNIQKQQIDSIIGKNVTSGVGSNNTQTVATLFGSDIVVDYIEANDCTNTGNSNQSFPQTIATGDGDVRINNIKLDTCVSGVVNAGGGGTLRVGSAYMKNMTDNGFYCFLDTINYVDDIVYEGSEEPVVVRECNFYLNSIKCVGRCLGVVNVESVKEVVIGSIVGAAPINTDPTDMHDNVPTGFLAHRSGNTASGTVRINSVSGDFGRSLITMGFNGTTDYINVENVNVVWHYVSVGTDPSISRTNFNNLENVNRWDLKNWNVAIRLQENDLTGSDLFQWQVKSAITEYSTVENVDFYLKNNDYTLNDSFDIRGPRQQEQFRIRGAVWKVTGGNPNMINANRGTRDSWLTSTQPTAGYFFKGQEYHNNDWDGSGVITKTIVCTVAGDPATFTTINIP